MSICEDIKATDLYKSGKEWIALDMAEAVGQTQIHRKGKRQNAEYWL